jgi:hypothetical protein
MNHATAIERTKTIMVGYRYKPQRTGAGFESDQADAEALETLLAELEPLAKTADGVPVYVGMAVWTRERGVLLPWPWRVVRIEDGSVGVACLLSCEGRYTNRLLTELYSSREAAEKGGEG